MVQNAENEKFGKLKDITTSPVVACVAFNIETNQSVVFSTTHAQDAAGKTFHNTDFNDTQVIIMRVKTSCNLRIDKHD